MDNYNTQENPTENFSQQSNGYSQLPASQPDSYLVWAIIATVLCCMPLGIVSVVYASRVDAYWAGNKVNEAIEASQKAKKWAIWSAVASIIAWALYILLYVLIFAAAFTSSGVFEQFSY